MGWFGGGGGDKSPSDEKSFAGSDSPVYDNTGPNMMSSGAGAGGGMGGGASAAAELQQFTMALQEQALVQQAITDLANRSFTKCTASSSHRDGKLTGKEVACIKAMTNKWLDCNELLVGRLQKKEEQQRQMMQQQQFS